jgi:hypothetical protein
MPMIKPVQGGVMTASHSVRQPVSGQRLSEMQNLPRLSRTGKGRSGEQMPTLFRLLLVRDVVVKILRSVKYVSRSHLTVRTYTWTLEWFQRDDANAQLASKQRLRVEIIGNGDTL